jgi:hypothetical protein
MSTETRTGNAQIYTFPATAKVNISNPVKFVIQTRFGSRARGTLLQLFVQMLSDVYMYVCVTYLHLPYCIKLHLCATAQGESPYLEGAESKKLQNNAIPMAPTLT